LGRPWTLPPIDSPMPGASPPATVIIGNTDEAPQRMREEILSTTAADILNFGDAIADVAAHGRVVVLGSEQEIDAANAERPGLLSVCRVI
jgi:Zn-dependent M16 (insulinase) family peptidase